MSTHISSFVIERVVTGLQVFRLARPTGVLIVSTARGRLEEDDPHPNMGISRISIPIPLVRLTLTHASPLLLLCLCPTLSRPLDLGCAEQAPGLLVPLEARKKPVYTRVLGVFCGASTIWK